MRRTRNTEPPAPTNFTFIRKAGADQNGVIGGEIALPTNQVAVEPEPEIRVVDSGGTDGSGVGNPGPDAGNVVPGDVAIPEQRPAAAVEPEPEIPEVDPGGSGDGEPKTVPATVEPVESDVVPAGVAIPEDRPAKGKAK